VRRVLGGCSPKCKGACCRVIVLPLPANVPYKLGTLGVYLPVATEIVDHMAEWLRARGCASRPLQHLDGISVVFVPLDHVESPIERIVYGGRFEALKIGSTCPQVTKRGKCKLHGGAKPKVCVNYPLPEDDLSVVPTCTYRIEEADARA
jgi:hypothetical protein